MDDERTTEGEKMDEVMLPGFRFHPTDEELVGFYLKRKVQQRPLSIELIKQLDIYKYDPWDLPKLASTGEKEWYFYCPRDRKYRNSARPNRVTGAGFWKATGTDRPIYSSEGTKCIGLKKSLVFYRGRAAKGVKTEWMMHEFRLPSLIDPTSPISTFADRTTIPAHESWAICRIFKKTNPVAHQRNSFSHYYQSQYSPLPVSPEATTTMAESPNTSAASSSLTPQSVVAAPSSFLQNYIPLINIMPANTMEPSHWVDSCPSLDFAWSYKTLSSMLMPGLINDGPEDYLLSSSGTMNKSSSAVDFSATVSSLPCSQHGGSSRVFDGYQDHEWFASDGLFRIQNEQLTSKGPQEDREQWDRLADLSYGPSNMGGAGGWKSNGVGWDTSELSTLFSTSTT
ncbi:hypothetical protein SAY86_020569 [Trapa natans]|uniref:NAC domain-containing protein n=1 Tax=Trapa natans TaxID=22666 RepID=A0AAN7M2S0_TRANT|nr:hypothetical protein SAY86_020569 [Trapa natans]